MKVSQYMSKAIVTGTQKDPIKKAVKTLFNLRIGCLPIVEGKKIVGFITRYDIVSKLYPSIQEFMQDYSSASNFDAMESKFHTLISKPVSQIMNRSFKSVSPKTPLMKAQSIMLVNDYHYLPVVEEGNNLVGIISHGDIFRALVGSEIPFENEEDYHDWLASHYDFVVQWDRRLKPEIESLHSILKKQNHKKIADLGCWTGEIPIALAKKGYQMTGLERSEKMIKVCLQKKTSLSPSIQEKIQFLKGGGRALNDMRREFDAVIIMGNSLSHYPHRNFKAVLEKVGKSLLKKGSTLIIQILNTQKILKDRNRILRFSTVKSKLSKNYEYSFLEFYDHPRRGNDELTLNMSILSFDGRRWTQSGVNSTPLANLDDKKLKPILKKLGFRKISYFGSMFLEPLFKQKFDIRKHDWLNIIASR